ncbi:hypothetical protein [Myceligenerans halotolerans]
MRSEFGANYADDLVQQVRDLEEDFYRSTAHMTAPDISSMGEQAAADFRAAHPGIPEEIVEAFAWCYTYDYK